MTTSALATLLQHAEAERDQALAALRRAEDQWRRLHTQAEQLVDYRGEYQQRWSAQFARRGQAEIVACYRSFNDRLDEAIVQQRAHSTAAHAQCERLRATLAAVELRVASVKKLIERRQAEQRRVQAMREQRQTDETAQHHRRRHAAPTQY